MCTYDKNSQNKQQMLDNKWKVTKQSCENKNRQGWTRALLIIFLLFHNDFTNSFYDDSYSNYVWIKPNVIFKKHICYFGFVWLLHIAHVISKIDGTHRLMYWKLIYAVWAGWFNQIKNKIVTMQWISLYSNGFCSMSRCLLHIRHYSIWLHKKEAYRFFIGSIKCRCNAILK